LLHQIGKTTPKINNFKILKIKKTSVNTIMEVERSLIKEFIHGGWIVPLVGVGAMSARLLVANKSTTIKEQIKKMLVTCLATTVTWFLLEPTGIGSIYKALCYGLIGLISPELINGIVKIAKSFESHPAKFIKK